MLPFPRIPDGFYQESRLEQQETALSASRLSIRDIMFITAIAAVICAGVKNVLLQTAYLSNEVQLKATAPTPDR